MWSADALSAGIVAGLTALALCFVVGFASRIDRCWARDVAAHHAAEHVEQRVLAVSP